MPTEIALQANSAARADRVVAKTLRTVGEIEEIREFWSSCPGKMASDIDIFLAGEAPLRPRVFVLFRDGRPVALLAGKIVRKGFGFRLGWLELFKTPADVITVAPGGLRGDASPENCRALVRAMLDSLKAGDADLAFLRAVEAGSPLFRSLKKEPGILFRDHFAPIRLRRKRQLPASVEGLYSESSHHERKRFRQLARKLSTEFSGQVRIDRFEGLAGFDRALAKVEEIAKKTWQGSISARSKEDPWLLTSLKAQAEGGWLRVYILRVADRGCAYWIGAVYQQTFYSEYIGYDPEYAKYSPGTYLLSKIMEGLCSEGVQEIDFEPSDEEYKRNYANIAVSEADLHVFAPTINGICLSAKNTFAAVLRKSMRAILERAGRVQHVKREWRKLGMGRAMTNGARS